MSQPSRLEAIAEYIESVSVEAFESFCQEYGKSPDDSELYEYIMEHAHC